MKVQTKTAALAAALLCAFTGAAVAETVKTPHADGSVNVRTGPGTGYSVCAWVKNGETITVLEEGAAWSRILSEKGKTGYIKNTFIEKDSTSTNTEKAVYALASVKTKYASSHVNVRKGPGTGYGVEFKAESGARMRLLGESGNWYLAEFENGKTGYISKNYTRAGAEMKTTVHLYLRSEANSASKVLSVLPKGTTVNAIGVSGNWTEVEANGNTGFVYSKYVK